MKILMVSNLYPPYYRGGYELHCAWVAVGLRQRGHDVQVLTSTWGLPGPGGRVERIDDVVVHRILNQYAYDVKPMIPPWTLSQARAELSDLRQFSQLLGTMQPDVVYWWSMNGLTKTMLPIPATRGIPDVHCFDDPWMILEYGPDGEIAARFWRTLWEGDWGPRFARPFLKRLGASWERRVAAEGITTRRLANRPTHVCFQSQYLQEHYEAAGFHFASAEVIYGGVKTADFLARRIAGDGGDPLRVLYAGQLSRDRGAHTAIAAIAGLDPSVREKVTLTIVGEGDPQYTAELQAQVAEAQLQNRITFRGKVPHAGMPEVYRTHDVLVFTSTRPEGQGFTMVEALLAGSAVLTTGSGGAMDVARIAQLPLFPKNDAAALGQLIARCATDRAWLREIAARGQEISLREFDADVMVRKQEAMLLRLAAQGSAARSG